tara:strand:+ start:1311 stop:1577 length:267 start_codon:yes stop_codon:yes gene_type:complete
MANIWIENHGVFTVGNDKVQELLTWLSANQAVQAEGTSRDFDGQRLLNEQGVVPRGDPNAKPVPTNTPKNPKPKDDGSGTYDFGTTWI